MAKRVLPRKVPCRDDKYMGLAFWMASFSKDPHTQMGAVIVSNLGKPLGWGYNGVPRTILDVDVEWDRPAKYDVIIHAEENAINHSFGNLEFSTLYVTGKPCKRCMLRIINQGIREVIYFPYVSKDKLSSFSSEDSGVNAEEIAKLAKVSLRPYAGNLNWMRDRIKELEALGIFV